MTEHDPTGPSLDEEGIPDLEGPLPEKAATGDGQEGVPAPSDRPDGRDEEGDLVAAGAGTEGQLRSPEESAIHIVEPGVVQGDRDEA